MHHMTILLLAAMQAKAYVSRVSGYFTTAYARFRRGLRGPLKHLRRRDFARYVLDGSLPILAGGAAATADITTRTRGTASNRIPYLVAASTTIYKSTLVAVNSTGYLVSATDSATDLACVGVAQDKVDNSSGSDGDKTATVLSGGVFEFVATSITQAMVGTLMYVVDNQTIDDAAGATNEQPAGLLVEFVSTTKGWIAIPIGGIKADVPDLTVATADIIDSAVTTAKINADAVDGTKLADDAVDSEHYTDGSIDAAHFAAGSVDATALATDAVTTAKILAAAVTQAKLEEGSVVFIDKQLTNTQVLALATGSGVEIIAAPGANKSIIVDRIHIVADASDTAWTEPSAPDDLVVQYNGGADISGAIEAGALVANSVNVRTYGMLDTEVVPETNVAVNLFNSGTNWGGGNAANTMSLRIWYSVVDTVAFS